MTAYLLAKGYKKRILYARALSFVRKNDFRYDANIKIWRNGETGQSAHCTPINKQRRQNQKYQERKRC